MFFLEKDASEMHFLQKNLCQDIFANPAHEDESRRKATSFRANAQKTEAEINSNRLRIVYKI